MVKFIPKFRDYMRHMESFIIILWSYYIWRTPLCDSILQTSPSLVLRHLLSMVWNWLLTLSEYQLMSGPVNITPRSMPNLYMIIFWSSLATNVFCLLLSSIYRYFNCFYQLKHYFNNSSEKLTRLKWKSFNN